MRFLVIRSGSGWGGVFGRYVIDTDESVRIDINTHYRLTGEFCTSDLFIELLQEALKSTFDPDKARNTNITEVEFGSILRKPTNKFHKDAVERIDLGKFDVKNLEEKLKGAKICSSDNTIFDIQVDNVYGLVEDNIVHYASTSFPLVWIEDDELRKLVFGITGIDAMYTMFLNL